MDETSGVALALKTGVPSCQVEDEESRTHLLMIWQLRKMETDGVSGRSDQAGFDSRSIFEDALVEE
jgi:hypothetical protein